MAAECPSGKYRDELVTTSGRTLASPLEDPGSTLGIPHSLADWSGSETDYAEWHELLTAIVGRLERSWGMLKTWPKTASMPAAQWNGFVDELTKVRTGYSELRIPWRGPGSAADKSWTWYGGPDFALDTTDEIAKTTQLLIDAQCLRERLDDALETEGGSPIRPGDTAHTGNKDELGIIGKGLLVLGAFSLVGGTFYIVRRVMK